MKHVVLVGMMGVGKTTVGRYVAKRLQRSFVDTDALIEQQEGTTIANLFGTKGEPYFRQRELETIRKVIGDPASVISIGGGAFLNPVVRYLLKDPAVSFYLQATEETLILRVGSGSTRPLLTPQAEEKLDDRLRRLLKEREATYELANYTVETDDLTPEQVGDAVLSYGVLFE